MLNKKGQLGGTLTWVVATIIIIGILVFFTFGASAFGATKNLVGSFKPTLFSRTKSVGTNLFVESSVFTYIQSKNKETQGQILKWIQSVDSINGTAMLDQIQGRTKLK